MFFRVIDNWDSFLPNEIEQANYEMDYMYSIISLYHSTVSIPSLHKHVLQRL